MRWSAKAVGNSLARASLCAERDSQQLEHVLGRYLISDKPMTEEEWARERATVIDDQTNDNEPARFGDGREEKHAAKRLEPKRK